MAVRSPSIAFASAPPLCGVVRPTLDAGVFRLHYLLINKGRVMLLQRLAGKIEREAWGGGRVLQGRNYPSLLRVLCVLSVMVGYCV